jgi:WD40 repeat protein
LSLDTESRVLYAGTADGKAFAFDAGPVDGDESTNGFECGRVLSAWVAHDDGVTRSVSHARGGCLTGSSTGPMYAWRVDRDLSDGSPPTLVRKMIGHVAAVVSISVGNPRHVVSGAHDGTVRVWNAPDLLAEDDEDEAPIAVDGGGGLDDGVKKSECLYAVTGHTVWLGGVQADETRIICDGANNIAMCYDFSEDPDDDGDI